MHVSESIVLLFPGGRWGVQWRAEGKKRKKEKKKNLRKRGKKDGKYDQQGLCLLRMIDRALFIWPSKL